MRSDVAVHPTTHSTPTPRNTMAYVIAEDTCIACSACVDACPEGAIEPKDPVYTIIAEKCIDCGSCESTCPNGAISAG